MRTTFEAKLTDNISSKALLTPYYLHLFPLSEAPFTFYLSPLLPSWFTEYGQFNIVETGIKITSIRIFALIKHSPFEDMETELR
ncbi:hypothetical protein CEXT_704201 [Caerostris extrusa]|uniref:Uncharacterized protein n=1 Tax=Caerostris extrusa TaxID=172846 RepID=A0AAV4XFQ8_CAEEX|nr:hypothetical protein CEXT_704201 [Caerostris extrusa]